MAIVNANDDISVRARDCVHAVIRDALRERLWLLTAVLILTYPWLLRTAKVALEMKPVGHEYSPFVYVMR